MKLPKKLRIIANYWKVEYKWRVTDDAGEVLDGQCEPNTKTIYITHGLSAEDQLATFLHEFSHAVAFELNLDLAPTWSPDMEEIFIEGLVQQLLRTFTLKLKK